MAPNQSMRSGMEALKSDGQRGDKADDDEDAEQVQGGKGIAQSEGRNPYETHTCGFSVTMGTSNMWFLDVRMELE